ncbi:MAG TPA: hypothetical protein VF723_07955 [Pyrinomonadaceae bacterium]|jgi:hypothetical protein
MNKTLTSLALALICLLCVVAAEGQGRRGARGKAKGPARPAAPATPAAKTPDYFPLRVGDWWKYRSTPVSEEKSEFIVKVLSTEKQPDGTTRYLLEKTTGDVAKEQGVAIHTLYSKTDGWVLMHKDFYVGNESLSIEYTPGRQYLRNPLVAGAKWEWAGKGMQDQSLSESSEVVGFETVEVPAGKFKAMKIVSKVLAGGIKTTKTFWYADGVGLVKSMTEAGAISYGSELLDYSFKNGAPQQAASRK